MNYNNLYPETLPEPLNDSQLKDYFLKYKNGDLKARNEIIKHNLRFVIHIVEKRFKNIDLDKEELVSIGTVGLIKAVDTYDVLKNIKFATYAGRCIENEILMFLRVNNKHLNNISLEEPLGDNDKLTLADTLEDKQINIELDYEAKDELNYYQKILSKALSLLDSRERQIINYYYYHKMTQSQIADKLNLSQSYLSRIKKNVIKKLKKIIEAKNINIADFSKLEIKEGGIKQMSKIRSIEKFFPNNTIEELLIASNKLSAKEKEILYLYYGLNGKQEQTTETIAKQYGYTKSSITTSVIPRIREKLKKILTNPNLIEEGKNTGVRLKGLKQFFPDQSLDDILTASNKLSAKEKEIFDLYYGLNGKQQQTAETIAKQCGYTKSSIQTGVIPRIRKELREILANPNLNETSVRLKGLKQFFPDQSLDDILTASNKLSAKEKEIFDLYYGLNGKQEQTTETIAKQYGYLKSTLQTSVIKRIRKKLRKMLVNPNLNEEGKKTSLRLNSLKKFFPNNTIEELLIASNKLSAKEKEIFDLYYGLNGKQEQTAETIAKQYEYAKSTLQTSVIPRIRKELKKILETAHTQKISYENIQKAIQEIEKQIYNNTFDENNLSYKIGDETIYVDIIDTKCSLAFKSSKTGLLDRIHAQKKKCLVYKIYLSQPHDNIQDKYIIKDKKTNKCYKYVYLYEDGNFDLTGVLNELVCFKMENIKIETLPSLNNNYNAQKTQEYIKRKKLIEEQKAEEKQYQINLEEAIDLLKNQNYSEAIKKLEASLKSTNPTNFSLS